MRKLGEQWVEKIDGQEHMFKVVANTHNCNGCAYLGDTSICLHSSILECPVDRLDAIIRDLGILNDEGCLPCPFCGKYPKIIHPTENMPVVSIVHTGLGHRILLEFFSSEQEAIDAWNRRV